MGIGVAFQLLVWLIYAIVAGVFIRYVAKHSLAIYCTRAKHADHHVRVFLRNLEDVPLDSGPYTLRIEVHPHAMISEASVRAGAKLFLANKSDLDPGIWEVYFEDLPQLDTWLFEMDAPSDKCGVTVTLNQSTDKEVALIRSRLEQLREKQWEARSSRSMHRFTTNSLSLDHTLTWNVAGGYATPRWSAVVLLLLLGISAYFLVVVAFLPVPETCASAASGITDCTWERIRTYMGWKDVGAGVALIVLALISTAAGLRRPLPVAQGYLEKSRLESVHLRKPDEPDGPGDGGKSTGSGAPASVPPTTDTGAAGTNASATDPADAVAEFAQSGGDALDEVASAS